MPTTKSAAKRLRQNIARRQRNRSTRQELRTLCKKVREALKTGDAAKAQAELRTATAKLDRAGAQRIIHPNAAARAKSRLSAQVKALKAKQPATP